MRSEKEIISLILRVADKDERIRAVAMNGSRINPNVPKDEFRDYDIAFLVDDFESFLLTPDWVSVFGNTIIMQTPEIWQCFHLA